jgi:AraC-like DNA-binding protein
MPIYMDLHIVPGVKAGDVAEAHRLDVLIQQEHHCKAMTYWIDESRGHVFCLIDAPGKEAVEEMHSKAHGLIPHRIIEVQTSLVESFLGRVSDPEDAAITHSGLKLINDPSFRIILVTKTNDPLLLQHQLGRDKVNALLQSHNNIIRKELANHGGMEAEHEGAGFIASFTAAGKAVACATAIQQQLLYNDINVSGFCISIHAGEPVAKNEQLFGDTIQLAERMCFIARHSTISISQAVKELVSNNDLENSHIFTLSHQDEQLLVSLFNALEINWRDTDFNIDDYCHAMAMSKSQLYRKTIILCGFSPNALLKAYRLEKAKELLKKKHHNISQITFDTGFTSPSYFTKCFKKQYGILPMAYLDMLD